MNHTLQEWMDCEEAILEQMTGLPPNSEGWRAVRTTLDWVQQQLEKAREELHSMDG